MIKTSSIIKYLKNTKDAPTREEVEEWLLKTDSHEVDQFLKSVWKEYSGNNKIPFEEKKRIIYELKQRMNIKDKSRKKIYLFIQRAAAVLFIPLLVFTSLYIVNQTPGDREKVVTFAPAGQQAVVLLPDGSEVVLNSCSKVEYASNFGKKKRLLFLDGEGYFKVTKSKKPFIVQTNAISVKVLGTQFDVLAYANDDKIVTTLEKGSILISGGFQNNTTRLTPGEQAVFYKKDKRLEVNHVKPQDYIAWKEGRLIFNNEHLTQITKKLERRFNVKITIQSPELYLDENRYTGAFEEENLTQILDAIKLTTPMEYEKLTSKEIILKYIKE